ncbi:nucleotidyltransferase [Taibaiella sp. KBW10]|uniref:nucleotidyltransferase family protein n=1 Tax=Taibaiella sp. KBW10 TaxID=2153357 RepID=UPI000F598074|nr:sugar phosphate nucleotidyltransferase [Taibaiella sp. KBW10]RQO29698.1 nucleotidyltransferase [Taibaiella sp. KBW10]
MKAFILSAGLGTRLKPFTDQHPKALAPVNGKSLLELNILNLQRFGIYDVVVNVHHHADQIRQTLSDHNGFGSRVQISDETNEVLETGGGLKKAIPFFIEEKDILVLNVDILSDFNLDKMRQQHEVSKAMVTLAVQKRPSSRYFLFKEEHKHKQLCGWRNASTEEQKLPCPVNQPFEDYAFSGIQLMQQSFLHKITQQGKFSLVDVYLSQCCNESIIAWDHTGDALLDVGKPESLELAATLFNL